MPVTLEMVGSSGKFKLKKSDKQWILISQSKLEDKNVKDTWNLAGDLKYVDTKQIANNLNSREYSATRKGTSTTFKLSIVHNELMDQSQSYTDPYTGKVVEIAPDSVKFSIQLSDWVYKDNSTKIEYAITMMDRTTINTTVDENGMLVLPSGSLTTPVEAVYTDDKGDKQDVDNVAMEKTETEEYTGTNMISFIFDTTMKPKIISYDPTLTLTSDNGGGDFVLDCMCPEIYEPVYSLVTKKEYSNKCHAVCTGNEELSNLVPIVQSDSSDYYYTSGMMLLVGIISFIIILVIILIVYYYTK